MHDENSSAIGRLLLMIVVSIGMIPRRSHGTACLNVDALYDSVSGLLTFR